MTGIEIVSKALLERIKVLESALEKAEKALKSQAGWLNIIYDTVKDIGKFLGNNVKLAQSDLEKDLAEIRRAREGK